GRGTPLPREDENVAPFQVLLGGPRQVDGDARDGPGPVDGAVVGLKAADARTVTGRQHLHLRALLEVTSGERPRDAGPASVDGDHAVDELTGPPAARRSRRRGHHLVER